MSHQESQFPVSSLKNQEQHPLVIYFISLVTSLYAFLGIIAIFLPGGIVEREEFIIYILGWLTVPIIAILTIIFTSRLIQKNIPDTEHLLWTLFALNAVLFTVLTTALNLSWQWTKSISVLFLLVYSTLVIVAVVNGLAILLRKWFLKHFSVPILQRLSLLGCLGFINFLSLFPDSYIYYQTPVLLVLVAIIASSLIVIVNKFPFPKVHNRTAIIGLDILVFITITLACLDPAFRINVLHENFYLGPVNRVLHGGTMLADTYSQYGNLVIYFISFLFRASSIPFTYQGLNFIIALLLIIQFIGMYLLLIALFKDRFYAILLLGILMLIGLYGTMGVMQEYPSVGPLRFGLSYLMLAVVYIRKRIKPARRWGFLIEYALIGIASLWSFETFVYCTLPYLGICFYESFSRPLQLRQSIKHFLLRLLGFLFTIFITQITFSLLTFFRSGKWPDWGTYLTFITTYSVDEFFTLPIATWSPWFFLIIIYSAALFLFLFRLIVYKELEDSPESVLLFGMTLMGIAFFTYYLGRSHPNNLYFISAPAVIIAGYGYVQLSKTRGVPVIFRRTTKFAFSTAIILIMLAQTPIFVSKVQQDHTGFLMTAKSIYAIVRGKRPIIWRAEYKKLQQGSGDQQVAETLELLKKYTPGEKDATIFLNPRNVTEILMKSGRLHRFPISDVYEDSLSVKNSQAIQNFPHGLKENDFIFLAHDPLFYKSFPEESPLQIDLIFILCQQFHFTEVESSPGGVAVIRLDPPAETPVPYCVTIRSLHDGK
jgi:hypothetical protein